MLGMALILMIHGIFPGVPACRRCHQAVWDGWQQSMHALAYSDPVFQASLAEIPEKTQGLCLSCHDPGGGKVGITCRTCHGSRRLFPFQALGGDTLRGPAFPTADTLPHPVQVDPTLRAAEFCENCHNVRNAQGFLLFTTYDEWKASPYALEGIQCQNCHMPQNPSLSPVDPPYMTQLILTEHRTPGAHSVEQVQKTLELVLYPVPKKRPVEVRVDLTNREAGHALPTGLPTKRVILEVQLIGKNDEVIARQSRIYARVVGDEEGNPLSRVTDLFLRATQTLSDNRLFPRKTRSEKIRFPEVSPDQIARVQARVYYDPGDLPIPEGQAARILLASASIPMAEPPPPLFGFWLVGLLILLLGLFLTGWIYTRKPGGRT